MANTKKKIQIRYGRKLQDNNASFEGISEAEYNKRHMKALKDADPGVKLTSPQAGGPSPQARKPKAQASSLSPQAPVSLHQGTSGPSPCPGNKQQG
jgi:hypothetical protein